jgi:hypothetical protein
MSFYFLTEFFKYLFRVLHEVSSSWLKFVHAFQKHPVLLLTINDDETPSYAFTFQHQNPFRFILLIF